MKKVKEIDHLAANKTRKTNKISLINKT